MAYKYLLVEEDDGIFRLTINRPDKLNALDQATLKEIDTVFTELNEQNKCRGIILTGAGEKSFVAGADISEILKLDANGGKTYSRFGQGVFNRIEQSRVPVIAAVNGYALGGGCELAMACHLRFASETARFGQPEVNLGIIPGFGGTQRLPRLVGKSRALELCLSGKIIDAQEAWRIGLVDRIVPAPELVNEAEQFLRLILSKGPLALTYVINSINNGLNTGLPHALDIEVEFFSQACSTSDKEEGTRAFLEKRTPLFRGE
jgi:enoyl-CoA hydratase